MVASQRASVAEKSGALNARCALVSPRRSIDPRRLRAWHQSLFTCMGAAWSSTGPTAAPPFAVVTAVTMPGRAMSEDVADQL